MADPTSTLDFLIRCLKEGNADQEFIANLQEIQKQQSAVAESSQRANETFAKTDYALENLRDRARFVEASQRELAGSSEKAGKGMAALSMAGGRAAETLLRQAGVGQEVMTTYKALELSLGGLAKGFLVTTGAVMGLAWAAGKTIGAAKQYEAATKAEIQSQKDLNWVLAQRPAILERATAAREKEWRQYGRSLEFTRITGRSKFMLAGIEEDKEMRQIETERLGGAAELAIRRSRVGKPPAFAADRTAASLTETKAVHEIDQELQIQRAKYAELDETYAKIAALRAQAEVSEELAIQTRQEALQEKLDAHVNTLYLSLDEKEKARKEIADLRAAAAAEESKKEELAEYNEELSKVSAARSQQESLLIQLEARQKSILQLSKEEKDVTLLEIAAREKEFREQSAEKVLALTREGKTVLEGQFALEAKAKKIEDDRVANAIGYLRATGHTTEAARLLTLELEKQKNALVKLTNVQQAGKQIAALGGLNVEALVGRGANLGERSQIRNLTSDFQQDYLREQNRLRRSGIKDPLAIQEKLAAFSAEKLDASPTLRGYLGVKPQGVKTATDLERDKLLQKADLGKDLEKATQATKGFEKEFRNFAKTQTDTFTDLRKVVENTDKQLELIRQQIIKR